MAATTEAATRGAATMVATRGAATTGTPMSTLAAATTKLDP
jgi:hypothetical protein